MEALATHIHHAPALSVVNMESTCHACECEQQVRMYSHECVRHLTGNFLFGSDLLGSSLCRIATSAVSLTSFNISGMQTDATCHC